MRRYIPIFSQSSGGNDNFPVGTILPYQGALTDIPNKWALCDGTNGTPNLLDGRFLEGSSSIGLFKSAGLPNIEGKFLSEAGFHTGATGPFERYAIHSDGGYWGEGLSDYQGMRFNASRSNPIYGASNTVQPRSYTVYFIMKIKK